VRLWRTAACRTMDANCRLSQAAIRRTTFAVCEKSLGHGLPIAAFIFFADPRAGLLTPGICHAGDIPLYPFARRYSLLSAGICCQRQAALPVHLLPARSVAHSLAGVPRHHVLLAARPYGADDISPCVHARAYEMARPFLHWGQVHILCRSCRRSLFSLLSRGKRL
jgi:hypothetical protein